MPPEEHMQSAAHSDCSITTVGNRRRAYTVNVLETTQLVLDDLVEDSHFFSQTAPRLVPVFAPDEVASGPELGTGEFGIVLEVSSLDAAVLRDKPPLADSGVSVLSEVSKDDTIKLLFSNEESRIPPREPGSPPHSILIKRTPLKAGDASAIPAPPLSRKGTSESKSPAKVAFAAQTKDEMTDRTDADHPRAEQDDDDDDDDVDDDDDDVSEYNEEEDEKAEKESLNSSDDDLPGKEMTGESSVEDRLAKLRARYARKVIRDGIARFAIKQVKEGLTDPQAKLNATLDLACEARYLAQISHTNVIRLRATVGEPGTSSFGLVLDRLTTTLDKRIEEWNSEHTERHRGLAPLLGICNRKERDLADKALYVDRLLVGYDIARAMSHLHRKGIIYRDVKPENIGFNVRGHVQVFDFGLAKELRPRDLVESPDGYDATGLTGSRRYMAPEVIRCLPYGFSADAYSFCILFWQLFSLETPFGTLDAIKHYDKVVEGKKRPHKLRILPSFVHKMMERGWSDDRSERPTMKQICQILHYEVSNVGVGDVTDRSAHLLESSIRSFATTKAGAHHHA